jgi:hypothetical protein
MPSTTLLIATLALSASATARAPAFSDAPDDAYTEAIARNLVKAGGNRPELERFLARYDSDADPRKRDASRWLVANMDGHGFALIELVAADGTRLDFDALDYKSLGEAKAALDAIEREHPGCDFKRIRFDSDLEHASADFLATHLDDAFDTWRSMPWSKEIRYEVFRDFILPYRGSNEPLGLWREPARRRLVEVCARNQGETDVRAFGEKVRAASHPWTGFTDLFYLHPTDQSYDEMCERRLGRCEDITNMVSFGMRSVAAICASDYTPWWAASDNNHAWEVVLDGNGRGRAGLAGRAAKVYRKTFAHQPDSLAAIKRDDESVPRWLSGSHYIDVTAQYQPVSDVEVAIEGAREGERYAYIAVFNGGEWKPIHWGSIGKGHAGPEVVFGDMGRNICYLPMLHLDGHDVPAGDPFVVDVDGVIHPLAAAGPRDASLEATTTRPDITDPDTGRLRARTQVKEGAAYELFVWRNGGWQSLGRLERGERDRTFAELPADGLFWLVEDGSEHLERIFTVDGGKQVFW